MRNCNSFTVELHFLPRVEVSNKNLLYTNTDDATIIWGGITYLCCNPTFFLLLAQLIIDNLIFQFSAVEHFPLAKSLAGELLDTYITDGIQLAWKMVTRIPPMIAVEPTAYNPHTTIREDCSDGDIKSGFISVRPILFFSYEGQVAVEGIVTTLPLNSGPARQETPGYFIHELCKR